MKKRYIFLYLFILVFSVNAVNATRVHGSATDYARQDLSFFVYEDFISETTSELFSLHIEGDGSFDTNFEIDKIQPVFVLTGIYKMWFIAEPNGDYELVFPDFFEKTKAEIYNPYFQPILLMFGIRGQKDEDVNRLVNKFDYRYNGYLDENLMNLLTQREKSDVNIFIDSLKTEFPQMIPDFFRAWKKYRFANIRQLAYERNHRYIINQYFRNDTVQYQNFAYMDLFLNLFENYFDRFLMRPDGDELLSAVNKAKSPYKISKVLSRMFELDNMALREYVVIKGLKDAYLQDNFKKKSIIITLDSISRFSKFPEHRIAALNVIEKLQHLAFGTIPPDFEYFDKDDKTGKVSDLKNRYLYIAFSHTELTNCQQELLPLIEMAKKQEGEFEVLLVLFNEDKNKAEKYLNRYDIPFSVVYPVNPDQLKKDWNIVSFPTYYLLGTNGKLIFSPSPSPLEYFENYFFEFVKK